MKFGSSIKRVIYSVLAFVLILGNVNLAHAVSFDDTQSIDGEMSVSKLVSLGIMSNPGESFNPDDALTRAEFALMVSKSMNLSPGSKALAIKDVTGKSPLYSSALKMVVNGFLNLDKGSFQPNKEVTYVEFSRVLAQSLGLKKNWAARPLDNLYYLDRKGILDIDTDLDASVSRLDAAVAFDKFLMKKGYYRTVSGLISSVNESANRIAIKTDDGQAVVTFNNLASIFVDGQSQSISSLFVGYPVSVTLDKAGKGAFAASSQTSTESGVLTFQQGSLEEGAGKLKIGETIMKNVDLNVIVRSLPNSPSEPFSLALLKQYADAGATISGAVDFTSDDEVTLVTPQIDKVAGKVTNTTATSVTVSFGKFSATFAINEDTKVENGELADVSKDSDVSIIVTDGTAAGTITLPAPAVKTGN